jgi:hypothetical protein
MTRAEFSKTTKFVAWQRAKGHCEQCTAKLFVGQYEYHHDLEDAFNGGNNLSNCVVLCKTCHGAITKSRAPIIAKSNRVRAKHIGIKRRRSSFATNKSGPFKRRMDGTVERRT